MLTKNLTTKIKEDGELEEILGEDFVAENKSIKNLIQWCLYNSHK